MDLVAVESDEGVSGGAPLDERLGLLRAIESLPVLDAGVLLVVRRDRLARDVVNAGIVQRLVERQGATVRSCDGLAAAEGPEGVLMRAVADAVAEYERLLIRSRTKAALAVKRDRGERTGGIPYGRRLAADGVRLLVDRRESEIIAIARRLRRRGRSLREIGVALEARGFRTRSGRATWQPGQVQALLRAASSTATPTS